MISLYNTAIYLYSFLIRIVATWNPKAKLFCKGREEIFNRLENSITHNAPIVWFHCASVGEFEQARPIIEKYKSEKSNYKVLLTFFSPSGYELRKNYELADWVFYLPIDTPGNAKRFIKIVSPNKAIFIKYEFWYNYLAQLKKSGIETYIASAIFRESQPFFKWYGGFFRKMLSSYTKLFVQDSNSYNLLESIGLKESVIVCGDTRFDRVSQITKESKEFPLIKEFVDGAFTLVAGSTWEPDNSLICKALEQLSGIKVIIASHEVSKERVDDIVKLFSNKKIIKFTKLESYSKGEITSAQVLIIDTIGILSSIYKYGNVAYIGGGFGVGIHNILEAATYSMPIFFGPNYKKFKEARDLVELKGAFSVEESSYLESLLREFSEDSNRATEVSNISGGYVSKNLGATDKIISYIEQLS